MRRRDLLNEIGLEDVLVFENPDYDSAIIGYDENRDRVIYDYELMVEHLMNEQGLTYEDAVEFIDYNTVRSCPYMGEKAPIIMRNIVNFIDYSKI